MASKSNKKQKSSYTNTKGQKVTNYTDGTKKVSGSVTNTAKVGDTVNGQKVKSTVGGRAYASGKDVGGYSDTFEGKGTASAGKDIYGNVITSASLSENPIQLPTKPKVDPMTGVSDMINGALGGANYDANTKQYTQPTDNFGAINKAFQDANATAFDGMQSQESLLREQRKFLDPKEKQVNGLQNQLNVITTSRDAQMLGLEGQGRGQTQSFIGGEQARISREAAITALPIQAQLAAAQDDLESARSYASQLFQAKSADALARYNYQKELNGTIFNFLNESEKRKLATKEREEDRAFQIEQGNRQTLKQLSMQALENGQTALAGEFMSQDANSLTYSADLANKVGRLRKPVVASGGGTSNQTTDNERALMSQFRGEQIVKDYNEILGQKGTIDAYIQNGVGGPADLALVFSFMKGLDPTSVVRETEYETAAKSGNIFQGVFAKFNGYFKEKGGFLPKNVQTEFQNLVNQKLKVKESQYQNVVKNYQGIAERQGLNSQNVIIDYGQGGYTPEVDNSPDAVFNSVVNNNSGGFMDSMLAPVKSIWNFITGK